MRMNQQIDSFLLSVTIVYITVSLAHAQVVPSTTASTNSGNSKLDPYPRITAILQNANYQKVTLESAPEAIGEPLFRGEPIYKLLANPRTCGTNRQTLAALMTLRQVVTGDEPMRITYELPISYDAITKGILGATANLQLDIDSEPGRAGINNPLASFLREATNGDCLLHWYTTYERPGLHALFAEFRVQTSVDNELYIYGPVKSYASTNLFQLHPWSLLYRSSGVRFFATLAEANGTYRFEITGGSGEHLKTITGATSNAIIEETWDLVTDNNQICTNKTITCLFQITLPDSHRTQILRQDLTRYP